MPVEQSSHAAVSSLSPRRREVLELVAKGLTNDDIARTLAISPATVRTHMTAVMSQLEVSNRTEAATAYVAWEAQPKRVSTVLARPAIAVLPFASLDETPASRTMAAGLTHDLGALFARWCWFPVIAHASMTDLPPSDANGSAAGRLVGARFVVSGSVRAMQSVVRLTVRIDDAESGRCLWTEKYDFDAHDVFDIQDDVCEQVVAKAYPLLVAHARALRPRSTRVEQLDAWGLAQEGMTLHEARERAPNNAARALFETAIEREPNFVLAFYGLGLTSYDEVLNQWGDVPMARRRLVASAERCLEFAPHAAEGHYLLGRYFQTLGDHARAVDALQQAIGRNPSFAAAHTLLAQALNLSGRPDEALRQMELAARLAPRSFVAGLATLHFTRGEYAPALEAVERAISMKPGYTFARVLAAASAYWLGDEARASAHLRAVLELNPDFDARKFLETFGAGVGAVDRIAQAMKRLGA